MRAALLLLVLAVHLAVFFLFAALRSPVSRTKDTGLPSIAFWVPLFEPKSAPETQPTGPVPRVDGTMRMPRVPSAARTPQRVAPNPVAPEPTPESTAITPPAVPDWRHELEIAANNQLASAERRRREPSVLAPHDFSAVKPGSTDHSRAEFGWDHAATHRVEELPAGGWLINISDHCAIAIVLMIMPVCKIGTIPARGDLFEHMKDPP
jgi:hypothetical protein